MPGHRLPGVAATRRSRRGLLQINRRLTESNFGGVVGMGRKRVPNVRAAPRGALGSGSVIDTPLHGHCLCHMAPSPGRCSISERSLPFPKVDPHARARCSFCSRPQRSKLRRGQAHLNLPRTGSPNRHRCVDDSQTARPSRRPEQRSRQTPRRWQTPVRYKVACIHATRNVV